MELSYASRKLKYKKITLKWKIFVFDFLVALLLCGLYTFFHIALVKKWIAYDNKTMAFGILISVSIATLIASIALTHFISYHILSKEYNRFYFSLLQNEAYLEDITIFKNKSTIQDDKIRTIESYIGIKNIVIDDMFTIASSVTFFDLLSLHYEKSNFGVMIKTKIDMVFSDIIQLRNDGRRPIMEYNQKKVKQYGVGSSYDIKEFAMYSSMNVDIYKIVEEGVVKDLYDFSSFCHCPLVVTIIEDNVFIFIDGWKMHLLHTLRERDEIDVIDVQIEALKMLQSYIEKINFNAQKKGEVDFNG